LSAEYSVKHIPHSWFGHLYQCSANALELTTEGITFISTQGQFLARFRQTHQLLNAGHLSWQQLDHPPVFSASLLGSLLSVNAAGTCYQIPFLSYFAKSQFKQQVELLWALSHENQLCDLISRIEKAISSRYLRRSLVDKIRPRIEREYRRWFPWSDSVELPTKIRAALTQLRDFYHWNNADVEHIREHYIQSQLLAFADFFDHVESNPLTDKQRRACIIDDDNNLLLAGAGTGKTSVMVGRAGYLVASGQAQADDILLLAYGKKAAKEMDQRIKHQLGTDDIKASTFHSLGLKIIAEVEGVNPSLSPWVNDEQAKDKWVHNRLQTLIEDEPYRKQVFDYFSHFYYVEKNPFEFTTEGDYFEYLNDNDIRSLKGERVKSFAELYIANWLFINGIEYQYEAKYEYDVSTVDFRQYQADFYLPQHHVYIEYYAIDGANNTAPYIDNAAYFASMEWQRQLHKKHQTNCIELFYYQHKKNQLINRLEQALTVFKVNYSPLPDDAILATLYKLGRVTELAKLFSQLIGLYKAACVDEKGLEQIFANAGDPQQTRKAFELLQPILQQYQQHLSARGDIDFEDMIAKALGYLQSGQYVSPWRYIMVDEFQDISEPRARLVRALRDSRANTSNTDTSLFCVGDDWQAIYRFSGADVSLTTQFSRYFGNTTETYLDLTFRFNNRIGEVASAFVSKNPNQINKNIHSIVQVVDPAISILRRGANEGATKDEPSSNALEQALNALSVRVAKATDKPTTKPTVYLLARFWFQLPDKDLLRQLTVNYPMLVIECLSFHASKGKEADYVVIMGLTQGIHGFPSKKMTPPILDAFLPQAEDFEFAEERRLFYVALTRAKHRVYVLADMTDASPFLVELIQQHYAIEQNEFSRSLVQTLFEQIKCAQCTTGTLIRGTGKFKSFFSCSHSPLCDNKQAGCDLCGSPMTRKRAKGFTICLSDNCGHMAPLCNICGADMTLRESARGVFWGCKNYRDNSGSSCSNTIATAKITRLQAH
tara:strand:- start:40578 stop:43574 length:2997 start_codon:yes stop_codon:yes gene_type:complete